MINDGDNKSFFSSFLSYIFLINLLLVEYSPHSFRQITTVRGPPPRGGGGTAFFSQKTPFGIHPFLLKGEFFPILGFPKGLKFGPLGLSPLGGPTPGLKFPGFFFGRFTPSRGVFP